MRCEKYRFRENLAYRKFKSPKTPFQSIRLRLFYLFIDDSSLKNDEPGLAKQKALEIQKNIISLTNHIAALSIAERDAIGLSFAYTTIENIFE